VAKIVHRSCSPCDEESVGYSDMYGSVGDGAQMASQVPSDIV